mmetsp:Transcript_6162/g.18622  ORF Transcript_6162/g.18622 Transcript_6162/m.18622 type:complete len:239 (-) Transcript_6162:14-730(-)
MAKRFFQASISRILGETPTVRRFTLAVERGFEFRPGQWIDLKVPGVNNVGGFSITSTPQRLRDEGSVEIAVKQSRDPVAQFLHSHSLLGVKVQIRSGGECVYPDGDSDVGKSLLLIAGGIGITPLMSIFRHACELQSAPHVVLVHSARSEAELAFRKDIECLCAVKAHAQRGSATVSYVPLVTNKNPAKRMDEVLIERQLEPLGDEVVAYVCGPPGMISDVRKILSDRGVRVRYETWW